MTLFHPLQMELMRIQHRGATERKGVKRENKESTEVKRSKGATGPEGEGAQQHLQHDAVSTEADESTMGTVDEMRRRDKKRMRVRSPKSAKSSDTVSC